MSIILSAPPADLPPAPELHLLPFALTPTPTTAPVSAYFHPRPAPEGHAFAGSRLASFRGRQVVGQDISVPRGYKGVILRAEGGGAAALSSTSTSTSTSSSSTIPSNDNAQTGDGDAPLASAGRTTRSMQKGAGQVALSRPRTARRVTRARPQKFALDEEDDDDEDNGEAKEPPAKRRAVEPKEEKEQVEVPQINVIPATQQQGEWEEADEMSREVDLPASVEASTSEFQLKPSSNAEEYSATNNSTRTLTPSASFTHFTLWTPDAPLAGFRTDEGEGEASETTLDEKEETAGEKDGRMDIEESKQMAAGPKLERGWWRQGGAGEGGDEFVRALGEWLGLNEIIHAPTYDLDDEDE